MKNCKDCGVEISEHATHTGCEQWCEDCFDKGLHKDMNDHFKNFISNEIQYYILKLTKEKESLAAKYISETGYKPSEICIVERETQTGRIFYFDLKSKHFTTEK